MKSYPRVIIALFIAALIVAPGLAQQMPAPLEKTVLPNVTTTIHYAGQTLVFTPTNVGLLVKLKMVSFTEIELRVRVHGAFQGQGSSGNEHLQICWDEYNECVYDDVPPEDEWIGGLYTEGGWTEK